jgi:hypothetical protein
MRVLFLLMLSCAAAFGQVKLQNAKLQNATISNVGPAGGGGGGGNTYTLLTNNTFNASSGNEASGTVDVTGAKLLVVSISQYQPGTPAGPSGGGYTYQSCPPYGGETDGIATNQMYYVTNLAGGTTFTLTCTRSYVIVNWAAFSYAGTTPTFIAQTGAGKKATGGTSSLATGSLAASSGQYLFVTGSAASKSFASPSIDGGFNPPLQAVQQGGNGLWGGLAYTNSTASQNPTWSFSADNVAMGVSLVQFQ